MKNLVGLALLAAAAAAQDAEKRVDAHSIAVMIGQYVDLETGTALSSPRVKDLVADLYVLRRGQVFELRPVNDALCRAGTGRVAPLGMTRQPLRIPAEKSGALTILYVKTAEGNLARVLPSFTSGYGFPAMSLRWSVNLGGTRDFPEAPVIQMVDFRDGLLAVRWSGPEGTYRVRVRGPEGSFAETTLAGTLAGLKGLKPGALHRIEVRRVGRDGVLSAPAIATHRLGTQRILRKQLHFPGRWYSKGGGLGIRELKAYAKDPDMVFFLYGVFAPGGVRHMGRGESVFRGIRKIPATRFEPLRNQIAENDVYCVRTKDGRYAKVWLHGDGAGQDYRYGMYLDVVFLAGGGRDLPASPAKPKWSREGRGLRIQWPALAGARAYTVRLAGETEELYRGARPTCLLALDKGQLYDLEVAAVYGKETESEPTRLQVHTYPERYKMGRFQLDCWGRTGYSFTHLKPGRANAEIYVSRASGGASTLTINAPHGIGKAPANPYGRFPKPGWKPGARVWTSNVRQGKSANWFCVRTKEGGVACVKVARRTYPNVAFEYIYAPPLWSLASVRVKEKRVEWGPLENARLYRIKVNDRPAIETAKTFCVLPDLGRNRFHKVTLSAVMKDGTTEGPLQVDTNTFSSNFRLGTITLQPYGQQQADFARGFVQSQAKKGDLTLRMLDANRMEVRASKGFELRPQGTHGDFPEIGANPGLTERAVVARTDLMKGVLLVRTRDGGWASVKCQETQQYRLWTFEYVYRRPISMPEVLKALAQVAPASDAVQASARELVQLLDDKDPTVRTQALAGLTKLGREAASVVLQRRQESREPDMRRLLDRWILQLYEREFR